MPLRDPTEQEKTEQRKQYEKSEIDTRTSHVDEQLHSRAKEGFLAWKKRRMLSPEHADVGNDWQHTPLSAQASTSRVPVLSTLAFIISLCLLAGALFFGYHALKNDTPPPQPQAKLSIHGKKAVGSGETLELQIVVENELAVPLELAELVVTYPRGIVKADNVSEFIGSERLPLGTIAAHSVRRGVVRIVVFGATGEKKDIPISLEYRVQGGSVIYQALAAHTLEVNSDSFSVAVEAPKEVISGQTNDVIISVSSEAKTVTHDVLATVTYPFGFIVSETSPEEVEQSGGVTEVHTWNLGDFIPGETKKIYIRGVSSGEEGDVRLFKIVVGGRADRSHAKIDTPLAISEHTAVVKKPFLHTELKLNGESPSTFSFKPGEQVKATVFWKNTLPVPLHTVSLGVVLSGDALRKSSVKASRGFYRSTDSQVIWDAQTKPETFKVVAPGASGTEEFQVMTLDDVALEGFENPALTFGIRVSGQRKNETGVPESIEAVSTHSVPVQTKATFVADARYFTSPFPRSGPLPPRVDAETVYAISWQVYSTSSNLEDAVVTAELPPNVRFRNIRKPLKENLVFDEKTRTITWYIGTLARSDRPQAASGDESEEGQSLPPARTGGRSVIFAVGLVPSASQIGDEPVLVSEQKLSANDGYSKQDMEVTAEDLDSILTEDSFDERYASVVE